MANSSDDAIRELVECRYRAIDRQDASTFDALVSSRVVVEVGSSGPMGLDDWRAHLQQFHRGFPDGRHAIEVSVGAIHIDRFQGDMVVAHRGQIDMHGLLAQLDDD